jgi:hypothetical protein
VLALWSSSILYFPASCIGIFHSCVLILLLQLGWYASVHLELEAVNYLFQLRHRFKMLRGRSVAQTRHFMSIVDECNMLRYHK